VRSFRRRAIVRVNPPANALKRRDRVMNAGARRVQRVYLVLLLLHAGGVVHLGDQHALPPRRRTHQYSGFCRERILHRRTRLFEVPTGVVADLRGRRLSYLLGTLTLALSTLLDLLMWRISAPFWAWALRQSIRHRVNTKRGHVRKVIVGAQVSMDGVMQAPGGPTEDPT
jgi:hypothetical protein